MPQRVYWTRFLGPLPANTVRVTRPTHQPTYLKMQHHGNPFEVGEFGRDWAVELFAVYAQQRLVVEPDWLAPLKGKDVACSCRLSEVCHGDVLLRLANVD